MKLPDFPPGVRLTIDVVFPGEYRIGYKYRNTTYVPGSGRYGDFASEIERVWNTFVSNESLVQMFPNLISQDDTSRARYGDDTGTSSRPE